MRREDAPPNLVLLVSDDHSPLDLGCYGNATISTPNVDRLAAEGLRFTRAFTPTSVCQPSRSAIHTGLHGTTSGADGFTPIRAGVATLSGTLAAAGWSTGLVGKSHLEPLEAFRFGFVKESASLDSGRDVDAIAEAAKSFVKESVAARKPFFLAVNFDDPHFPWPLTPEEASAELPRWQRRAAGIDPRHRALGNVAGRHDLKEVRVPPLLPDRPVVRWELARYADAVGRMDRGVGLVLEGLEELAPGERTLVLFLSDNGMDFPFHKTTLWDGGIHLPLIARWPGVTPRGATCAGIVSFVDLMPTLLEAARVAPVEGQGAKLEGRSFHGAFAQPDSPLRDALLLTHTRHRQDVAMPSRGIRTATHKYLRNFWPEGVDFLARGMRHATWEVCLEASKDDPLLAERIDRYLHRPPVELYDLQHDPLETQNLAGTKEHATIEASLLARLVSEMTSISDPLVDLLK